MTIKTAALFVILFAMLPCSSQSAGSDRKHYDTDWLPPAVGISGERKTQQGDTTQENKKTTDKKEQSGPAACTTEAELRSLIGRRLRETFSYPEQAKKRKVEGTVSLTLTISKTGRLLSWKKDGDPPALLLQAAVSQLQSVFPLDVMLEKTVPDLTIQINYTLR